MAILTVDEIREFVSDYEPNNYLIDGEEFTNTYINLCMSLGADSFNSIPPFSRFNADTIPSKTILLYSTLFHMYRGKATLLARNTMQYSDGGLQIPIEERAELYLSLATGFQATFIQEATKLKIQMNMEAGWGHLSGDSAYFPMW